MSREAFLKEVELFQILVEAEIRGAFEGPFEIIRIRDFRFDTSDETEGPLGYSCLMKRK